MVSNKTAMGQIIAANAIPVMLAPKKQKNDDNIKVQTRQNLAEIGAVHDKTMELLDKIYLSGLQQEA